ncbi:hypothetical protein ABMY20_12770 [Tenacibaculum sp. SSH1-16]|uniref:hypothetical protein n=1 Tax=Tenacibaculum sp. SSH1-16 TaxID=3136667 RepID=UPI0032C4387A
MKELQTRRFSEQIAEILKSKFSLKLVFEGDLLVNSRVNTESNLDVFKIKALMAMAERWSFKNLDISRSGAGLKIQFLNHVKGGLGIKSVGKHAEKFTANLPTTKKELIGYQSPRGLREEGKRVLTYDIEINKNYDFNSLRNLLVYLETLLFSMEK